MISNITVQFEPKQRTFSLKFLQKNDFVSGCCVEVICSESHAVLVFVCISVVLKNLCSKFLHSIFLKSVNQITLREMLTISDFVWKKVILHKL